MGKVNDVRGKPGDIVMPRGGRPIAVWCRPTPGPGDRAGTVMPAAMGMIVATYATAWTYVLWSMPCITGWVLDGELRRL